MPRVGVASPCIATRSSGSGLPRRTQRKATAPLLLAGNGAGTRLGSTGSAKSASNIRISTKLCRRHDGSRVGWAGTAFIRHDTKAVRIDINEEAHAPTSPNFHTLMPTLAPFSEGFFGAP